MIDGDTPKEALTCLLARMKFEEDGWSSEHYSAKMPGYERWAEEWAEKILEEFDNGQILPEFVQSGVCMSCGGAVLRGEHLDEERHAKYTLSQEMLF